MMDVINGLIKSCLIIKIMSFLYNCDDDNGDDDDDGDNHDDHGDDDDNDRFND